MHSIWTSLKIYCVVTSSHFTKLQDFGLTKLEAAADEKSDVVKMM